jgi:hypothetical protein
MNSLQQRLAAVTDTAANLKAQLRELNRLRDQVRKAQQSTQRPQPERAHKIAQSIFVLRRSA